MDIDFIFKYERNSGSQKDQKLNKLSYENKQLC